MSDDRKNPTCNCQPCNCEKCTCATNQTPGPAGHCGCGSNN